MHTFVLELHLRQGELLILLLILLTAFHVYYSTVYKELYLVT
jgi:hypothetical protein